VHEVVPPRSTGGWCILIAKLNASSTNRLELHKQSELLRHGLVDLETGEEGDLNGLEVRTRGLFRDHFIGVVRADHALNQGDITPKRYASGQHILVSRRGTEKGPSMKPRCWMFVGRGEAIYIFHRVRMYCDPLMPIRQFIGIPSSVRIGTQSATESLSRYTWIMKPTC
jgi:DNA-binding transcriptional LysR family regulator